MIRRLAAALAAALLLAACGDDGDGRYDARVDEVRQAVESGDREGALAILDQLGAEAFAAHSEGEVGDEELAELAELLEQARIQIDDQLAATTTTEATTTAPPTTPPAPVFGSDSGKEHDEDDKDDKKDKGKGEGGDDGDDDDD